MAPVRRMPAVSSSSTATASRLAIHDAAAGFDTGADAYERGRASYPTDAIAFLAAKLSLSSNSRLVDIGAGTGKLTRLLIPTGARIVAIEPVAGMRRKFAEVLPEVEVREGAAESIPLDTSSVDAAVAGQAFHWFANPRALAEIHRVLKPGGRLGLIWNARDESVRWSAELTRIVNRYQGDAPRYVNGHWRIAFDNFLGFRAAAARTFRHVQAGSVETILDRVASISFIAKLADSDRAKVLAEVQALVDHDASTRDRSAIEFAYRTDVYVYEAQPSAAP